MKIQFLFSIAAALTLSLTSSLVSAQITTDNSLTIEELVNDVLLGEGVVTSNITYNGMPGDQVSVHNGSFDATGSNFLINEGVVMATSSIELINGGFSDQSENFQNDPDLVAISGFNMNNCAVIEFDFTVESDSVVFDYIFASEEYPGFTCSSFNDAFGFFLSGPGITGPFSSPAGFPGGSTNIALIPNSIYAVGVNSVNSGVPSGGGAPTTCLAVNPNFVEDSQYFIPNNPADPNSIQIQGHTVVFTARAQIQCGETYHIKMAIGNASDTALQSAVFLRKGSFTASGEVFLNVQPSLPGVNLEGTGFENVIVAGCFSPLIELIRPTGAPVGSIFVSYGGTAVEGVDFELGENDTLFTFGEGVDTLLYTVNTIPNPNAPDTLFLDFFVIFETCGGFDTVIASIPIIQPYEIQSATENVTITCPADSTTVTALGLGGVPPYNYNWVGETPGQSAFVPVPPEEFWYVVEITDQCEFQVLLDSVLVVNNIPPPLNVSIPGTIQPLCPTMPVTIGAIVADGNGDYFFDWSPVQSATNEVTVTFPQSLTVYLTVTDTCGTQVSDSVFVSYPIYDNLLLSLDLEKRTCPENPLAFVVNATGGAGEYRYAWTEEDNNGSYSVSDQPETDFMPEPGFSFVGVTVDDVCFRTVDNPFLLPYVSINEVSDTLKVVDLRKVPNVITPNRDQVNDFFAVPGLDIFPGTNLEVWDRWGTSVFASSDYRVGDIMAGYSNAFNGEDLSDGSYFFILNVNAGECVKTGYMQILGSNPPNAGR